MTSSKSKRLVLGTKNEDKLRELKRLLRGTGIEVLSLRDFPQCREARETGRTFEANAVLKAKSYSRHTRCLTLADDSGLLVRSLNGRPGVYSARFAGPGCTYSDNNKKLLRLLSSHERSRRAAKFVSVIAMYDSGRKIGVARGECAGRIAMEEKGAHGFGYDPVFIPNGLRKTFAELTASAKNKISHRGKALQKAKKMILKQLLATRAKAR